MNDPETLLQTPKRAAPRPAFERSIDDLFAAHAARPSFISRPVPLWMCVVSSLLLAAFAVLAFQALQTRPVFETKYTENVYYVFGAPEQAAAAATNNRGGFLTDPKRIRMNVYSISHEESPKNPGKT